MAREHRVWVRLGSWYVATQALWIPAVPAPHIPMVNAKSIAEGDAIGVTLVGRHMAATL